MIDLDFSRDQRSSSDIPQRVIAMRYIAATAVIIGLGLPAIASAPARNEKTVSSHTPKEFDGVNHKNFTGNIIGLQLPTAKPPLQTWELFRMAMMPELAMQWAEEWAQDRLIDWLYGVGKGRPGSIWQLLKDKVTAHSATD